MVLFFNVRFFKEKKHVTKMTPCSYFLKFQDTSNQKYIYYSIYLNHYTSNLKMTPCSYFFSKDTSQIKNIYTIQYILIILGPDRDPCLTQSQHYYTSTCLLGEANKHVDVYSNVDMDLLGL